MRVFSDLNLDGSSARADAQGMGTPVRVRPRLGEWGPANVPTTRNKKRQRVAVVLVFLTVLAALCYLGWFFYKVLNGVS